MKILPSSVCSKDSGIRFGACPNMHETKEQITADLIVLLGIVAVLFWLT